MESQQKESTLELGEIELNIDPDVPQKLKDLFPAESQFKITKVSTEGSEADFSVEITVGENKYSGLCIKDGTPIEQWELERGGEKISITFQKKSDLFEMIGQSQEELAKFQTELDGQFVDGLGQLVLGSGKFTDGLYQNNKYNGEFLDNKFHGQGIRTYANGEIYEGYWKNNKQHGKGKYTFKNGTIYEGDWEDGERNGQGTCTYTIGRKYEGDWKDGEQHGQGKYTYAGGNIYEGEWKYGKRDGKGTFTYTNGNIYDGDWQGGVEHGKGTFTYPDGEIYDGEWKYGAEHGQGKYTFKNGTIYEGDWEDGERNGQGTCTYASGDIYNGEWQGGAEHGQGTCTFANGLKYAGEFKEGKMMKLSNKHKENNKIETLLLRSSEMNEENRPLKYENDKFLDGGKPVKAVVCEDSKAVLTEVNQFIKNNKEKPTEKNSKCRIVFDQHGDKEGDNNMSIDSKSAKKILENLADAGFKEITISDLACHGGTAYHFLKVAQDFVKEHEVVVKVRSAPKDRVCINGIKVNNNDEKRFTMVTIGKDGSGKSRDVKVFEPQPKSTEVSNPNCKEEEKQSILKK